MKAIPSRFESSKSASSGHSLDGPWRVVVCDLVRHQVRIFLRGVYLEFGAVNAMKAAEALEAVMHDQWYRECKRGEIVHCEWRPKRIALTLPLSITQSFGRNKSIYIISLYRTLKTPPTV